jgi:hypothetical protein
VEKKKLHLSLEGVAVQGDLTANYSSRSQFLFRQKQKQKQFNKKYSTEGRS